MSPSIFTRWRDPSFLVSLVLFDNNGKLPVERHSQSEHPRAETRRVVAQRNRKVPIRLLHFVLRHFVVVVHGHAHGGPHGDSLRGVHRSGSCDRSDIYVRP